MRTSRLLLLALTAVAVGLLAVCEHRSCGDGVVGSLDANPTTGPEPNSRDGTEVSPEFSGATTSMPRVRLHVVRAEDGLPVRGAVVGLDAGAGSWWEETAPSSGTLLLPYAPLGTRVHVEAVGRARTRLELSARSRLTVRLLPTGSVRGRVVAEEDGRGIGGVTVVALGPVSDAGTEQGREVVLSDADGAYLLRGLEPGVWRVLALGSGRRSRDLAPDAGPDRLTVRVRAGEPVTRTLIVVAARELRGRVESADGLPVQGAVVTAETLSPRLWRGLGGAVSPVQSDAKGEFEFSAVVPGVAYALTAQKSGELPAVVTIPGDGHDAVQTHILRFPRSRALDLRVRGPAGEAVRDVQLDVFDATASHGPRPIPVAMRESAAGIRLAPLPTTAVRLLMRAPGYIAEQIDVAGADESGEVEVELRQALQILGSCFVGSDAPTGGGVLVRAYPEETSAVGAPIDVFTDATGAFRIDGLLTGAVDLEALATYGGTRWVARERISAGSEDVVLHLAPESAGDGACVEVLVRYGDGPVERGEGRLFWRGADGRWQRKPVLVRGGYVSQRVPTADAPCWIEFTSAFDAHGRSLRVGRVLVGPLLPGGEPTEVLLAPAPPVTGEVVSVSGAPLVGVRVEAWPAVEYPGTAGPHDVTWTDDDGRFELRDVASVPYRLDCGAIPGHVPPAGIHVSATHLRMRLVARRAVTPQLRVVMGDGTPVAGARVELSLDGSDDPVRTTVTDGRGVATLRDLAPDALYTLRIDPASITRYRLRGTSMSAWSPRSATVTLYRGQWFTGVVVDAHGAGIEECLVWARDPRIGWAATVTGADGEFELETLGGAFEECVLTMDALEDPDFEALDRHRLAKDVENRLVWDVGPSIRLRADGWGSRRDRVVVRLVGAGEHHSRTLRVPVGAVRFVDLRADVSYEVFVTDRDGRFTRLLGIRPREDSILLEPETGLRLSGSVRLADGGTVRGGTAVLEQGAVRIEAKVDPAGKFELRGVPPGTWPLRFEGDGDDGPVSGTMWASTGSGEAPLEIVVR